MKGKLLSKAPCNTDLFEGGSHKKLANVIATEIINNDKCTIIGIDGGWGAGKSNLVGMIKNNLCTNNNTTCKYHFFTYDAWGHQADLQRRTILEELTYDLVGNESPILDEESWRISLDNLLAKKKQTSTKTVPAIGKGTILSLFALILTPFISHLASLIEYDWLKPLILIIPYVLGYGYIFRRHYLDMKVKYKQEFSWERCLSEFFLVYKDSIKKETKFETISEKEPSSRQFKEWIHKIDKGLKENNNTILVLVIDNMDRLPKLKVQELWSAIHSCFSEEQYTNIRIIVPFDRSHIRNAFQSEDIIKITPDSSDKKNKVITYGDDFINKTFYVVYSVPPPILSGWMHYFCDKWQEAFGKNYKVDNSVLQIYDMLTQEHSPRKIIAFINQFVTLRNLCEDKIEDKYIALYIFGRAHIVSAPLEQILHPTYLKGLDFLYQDDDQMKQCISSLYYQLPIDKAMDIVFSREVTSNLDENKTETLDKLKDSSKYWEILNHSITKVSNVENATLALNRHFGNNESVECTQIWNTLFKKSKLENAVQDKYFKEYHSILLSHISDKTYYFEHLLKVYHNNIDDNIDLKNYLDGVDKLQVALGNVTCDYIKSFTTKITPENYLKLIELRKEKYTEYGLDVESKSFDEYLSNLETLKIADTCIYPYTMGIIDTPKYIEKVKKIFKENTSNINITTSLLNRIKEIETKSFDISNYWDDNVINNLLSSTTIKDAIYPDLISMAISRYTNGNQNIRRGFTNATSSYDDTLVKRSCACLQYYYDYGNLLANINSFTPKEFVCAVAKELTIGQYDELKMNVETALKNYESIKNGSSIEYTYLLERWNKWNSDLKDVNPEDVKSMPISLFKEAQNIDNEFTKGCLTLADKYLASISQDAWCESILKEDFNFNLLYTYHSCQYQLFIDAFKELMHGYAKNELTTPLPSHTVNKVIEILLAIKYEVKNIFQEIRDIFIGNSSISKEKLKYYINWLLKYGELHQNQHSIAKILKSEYLEESTIISSLIEHKENVSTIIQASANNEDFYKKLKAMRDSSHKDNVEFIKFCDYIGIVEAKA